jgi:hypothetical protein
LYRERRDIKHDISPIERDSVDNFW